MNMKFQKYFWGLFIAVIAGLTSCNTDVEGEYYTLGNVDGELVSFETKQYAVQLPKEESSVTIPVKLVRSNAEKALTVELNTTASHDGIFTMEGGNSISFQPGQQTATFNVIANNLEKEVPYQFAISLDDKAIIDTLFLANSTSETYKTFIPGVEDLDHPEKSTNDTIVIDTVKTNYYVANPVTTMQIRVSREGDWTPWAPWNSEGTGDYTYSDNYFKPGDDPDLPFTYRQSLSNPNLYKLRIEHWGYDVTLILDYDKSTGHVTIPPTFTGATESAYGDVYITDAANYTIMNGGTPKESDYGTFDEEQGIITLKLYYYVSAGYFGNTPEYFYIDGFVRGDYTSSLSYIGVLTNADNEVFAVGNLELGPDATDVKAIVMPQDADADAVADALASGDLEGYDVEAGQIQVPIPEDLTGKLQVIVAVISDGVVKSVSTASFEYYGGGANPWVSLGTGYLVDDLLITSYIENPETRAPFSPKTYAVEILENKDQPGLYRIVDAFKGVLEYLDFDYTSANLEVNATDPNNVYIETQSTGVDDGDGEMFVTTYGNYMLDRYDFETLASYGYFGKLENGVITFPVFSRKNDDGDVTGYHQGIMFQGSSGWYVGPNGAFKIALPGSSLEVAMKKAAAKKSTVKKNAIKVNMLDRKVELKSITKKQKTVKKTKLVVHTF